MSSTTKMFVLFTLAAVFFIQGADAEARDGGSCPTYPLNLAWGCAYQDACFSFKLGSSRFNFLGFGCSEGTICCPGPCGHRCLTPV
ncbi:Hypp9166 [Branchiostoma lanceolatum]|uniref:Hypp9166 protein n=1 Tax=Branchiostoma lanceolatum TaxID=7740 RepID=A0A8J9ZDS2_BRALA|nr:Hypp9166 [Branchiostoma lanceolatum]